MEWCRKVVEAKIIDKFKEMLDFHSYRDEDSKTIAPPFLCVKDR